jgi:hypothetical protein
VPTVAREPAQWRLPLWLGWLPGTAAALAVGLAGLSGAWTWVWDGYHAGLIAQRLASSESPRKPLPPGVAPTTGSWWRTTATHLVQWAAYRDRDGDDPEHAEEARALLDRAAQLSPLHPTVRYALARPLPGETIAPGLALVRSLGPSRDVPALALLGHSLLASGKKESALRAYHEALEMAARTDPTRSPVPAFLDEAQVRRYALPTEDDLGEVIRDMAGSGAWSYKDWAGALPRGTAAAVVAARVLRATGSPDAGAALAAALSEAEAEPADEPGPGSATVPATPATAAEAIRLAAGAEALAMKQRWADARDRYRRAIDRMPVDVIRRAWWVNLADLESRLNEEPERLEALETAKVADLKDEITRRVVEIQKASGAVAQRSGDRSSRGPGAGSGLRR